MMLKLSKKISILIIPIALTACTPRIVYKEVKIPIKCDAVERERPKNNGSIIAYLKDILIYTEGLEHDLNYCKGVK